MSHARGRPPRPVRGPRPYLPANRRRRYGTPGPPGRPRPHPARAARGRRRARDAAAHRHPERGPQRRAPRRAGAVRGRACSSPTATRSASRPARARRRSSRTTSTRTPAARSSRRRARSTASPTSSPRSSRRAPDELDLMQDRQVLLSALHLGDLSPATLSRLMDLRVTAIGFEFIADADGSLPIVRMMHEISGSMAVQTAARLLESGTHPDGRLGRGLMLGGISGVPPASVVILGAGVIGEWAARTAIGFGAHTVVLDTDLPALRQIEHTLDRRVTTAMANPQYVRQAVAGADVVIGAMMAQGQRSPVIVTEEMVARHARRLGRRGPRHRPGRLHRDAPPDDARPADVRRPRRRAPLRAQPAVVRRPDGDVRALERAHAVPARHRRRGLGQRRALDQRLAPLGDVRLPPAPHQESRSRRCSGCRTGTSSCSSPPASAGRRRARRPRVGTGIWAGACRSAHLLRAPMPRLALIAVALVLSASACQTSRPARHRADGYAGEMRHQHDGETPTASGAAAGAEALPVDVRDGHLRDRRRAGRARDARDAARRRARPAGPHRDPRVVGPQRQHPRDGRALRQRGLRRARGRPLRRPGRDDARRRDVAHAGRLRRAGRPARQPPPGLRLPHGPRRDARRRRSGGASAATARSRPRSRSRPTSTPTVIFYGGNPPTRRRPRCARSTMPVLGLYGGADSSIPQPAVDAFDAALTRGRRHARASTSTRARATPSPTRRARASTPRRRQTPGRARPRSSRRT